MRRNVVRAIRITLVVLGAINAAGAYIWLSLDTRFALAHAIVTALVACVLLLWRPTPPSPAFPEYMDVFRRAR